MLNIFVLARFTEFGYFPPVCLSLILVQLAKINHVFESSPITVREFDLEEIKRFVSDNVIKCITDEFPFSVGDETGRVSAALILQLEVYG